jgi:hypothetical protein
MNLQQLVIYRNILENNGIKAINKLLKKMKTSNADKNELQNDYNTLQNFMLNQLNNSMASEYVWKDYVINLLLKDVNPFTLMCENQAVNDDFPLYEIALGDLQIIKDLFHIKWKKIGKELDLDIKSVMTTKFKKRKSTNLKTDLINLLDNGSIDDFAQRLCQHYYTTGCGKLGAYIAFKWKDHKLVGVDNVDPIQLNDLVGYTDQKEILVNNTEAFIAGKKANNVLLYGDKGTGKSSSVKAVLNKYASNKLRMIEITKDQIIEFPAIVNEIRHRNFRFIIFIDDLSFESFETEYKHFKAILEGGLEIKSDNVLIYVTSNRRHLIKENWSDRNEMDGEVHIADSVQEKLSLVDRFGITINYTSPNKKLFLDIVTKMADDNNLEISKDELIDNALVWEMRYHGRSGRSARQYIDYLMSKH